MPFRIGLDFGLGLGLRLGLGLVLGLASLDTHFISPIFSLQCSLLVTVAFYFNGESSIGWINS